MSGDHEALRRRVAELEEAVRELAQRRSSGLSPSERARLLALVGEAKPTARQV